MCLINANNAVGENVVRRQYSLSPFHKYDRMSCSVTIDPAAPLPQKGHRLRGEGSKPRGKGERVPVTSRSHDRPMGIKMPAASRLRPLPVGRFTSQPAGVLGASQERDGGESGHQISRVFSPPRSLNLGPYRHAGKSSFHQQAAGHPERNSTVPLVTSCFSCAKKLGILRRHSYLIRHPIR